MATDSVIERAARALATHEAAQGLALATVGETDEQWIDRAWPSFVEPARAVLTAIREPSEAMVQAGNRSKPYNISGFCEGTIHPVVQRAWPAMIDAALKE